MPLVDSRIAANLPVRALRRANIYSIFIRLFTNTVIVLFTVIAATKTVCHCLLVYDRAVNQIVCTDFAFYHLKKNTETVPQSYLKVIVCAERNIRRSSKIQHIFDRWRLEHERLNVLFFDKQHWVWFFIHQPDLQYVFAQKFWHDRIWQRILQDFTYR